MLTHKNAFKRDFACNEGNKGNNLPFYGKTTLSRTVPYRAEKMAVAREHSRTIHHYW
jgi:hypothetical protein